MRLTGDSRQDLIFKEILLSVKIISLISANQKLTIALMENN
jgi:hypothetical protein